MAAYWEDNRCSVCAEPLDTKDEQDMGVHEGCDLVDRVSGVNLPIPGSDEWANLNKCVPEPLSDEARRRLSGGRDEMMRDALKEARERAMWLDCPDGQGGG